MNKALIDTDIFSEIIKGKNTKVIRKAEKYYTEKEIYTISIFTVLEILKGFYKKNLINQAQRFLLKVKEKEWEILDIEIESIHTASKIYGELEKIGKPIGNNDPMIASIAIENQLALVTGNTKHYERIQELGYPLLLENWKE